MKTILLAFTLKMESDLNVSLQLIMTLTYSLCI